MFLCIPVDEFMEPAHRTVGGSVLIQEREMGRLEFFEEILPRNRVQRLILWAEIQSQQAGVVLFPASFHMRRTAAARFCPLADGLVICGEFGFCHGLLFLL